jgi:hypothetical protein
MSNPVSLTAATRVRIPQGGCRSANGLRVMGFAGLMTHLGTLTRNTMRMPPRLTHRFTLYAEPAKLQEDAFRLLNIQQMRVQ